MGLSSNILWHQTKASGFYKIIESRKLLYSYCLERIVPLKDFVPVAFPMISLSDFPFSEIANNKWTYGNYSIGFKREWGIKAGFSPVWYCSFGSRGFLQLCKMFSEAVVANNQGLLGEVMYLFSQMKFVESSLLTSSKRFKNYRFYDERENRLVPYITETDKHNILPYLSEDEYQEFKQKNNNASLLDFGVDFSYDDIKYIIVENEEDVNKVKEIIGNSNIHIFTKADVIVDIIGVDHHEEIVPSQESMDYAAALRHMDRVKNGFMEMMSERKQKTTSKE